MNHDKPSQFLGGLTPKQFLSEYWQKKPLLIRQAIPNFQTVVSPDAFLKLAEDEDVASRIVFEKDGEYPWQALFGPIDPYEIEEAPKTHWTLLIQEMDRHVQAVNDLWKHVPFIPNWRRDDIMISFAPPAGGVGPHIDQYDVFLLQAHGRREWRIGTSPIYKENLIPDLDLGILADFTPDETWILEPGDMLYIPPKFAHDGVAVDECMTYSFGFRAPAHQEVVNGFFDSMIDQINPMDRFTDPDLQVQTYKSNIKEEARQQVREIIRQFNPTDAEIDHWFGEFMTTDRRDFVDFTPSTEIDEQTIVQSIKGCQKLQKSAGVRLAWIEEGADKIRLFIQGETYLVSRTFGLRLAESGESDCKLSIVDKAVLLDLCRAGYFYFD